MSLLILIVVGYVFYRIYLKKKEKEVKKEMHSNVIYGDSSTSTSDTDISHAYLNQDDDEFATFTISYGSDEEKSTNTAEGIWVKSGESISIKGVEINAGFIYFGGKLNAYAPGTHNFYHNQTESSLVDDSLSIELNSYLYEDESLAYWPKFNSISAECRGAYINWLSSERSDPETPLGYVFIYFYGIERRVLVDGADGKVDDKEFLELYKELRRLNEIYSTSRSFSGYCGRLMEMMSIMRSAVIPSPKDDELYNSPMCFKLSLSKTVVEGAPISATMALNWLKYNPEYNLRTPARRCFEEFSILFKKQYINKYGEGIFVKPNKTKLVLDYFPASSTLHNIEIEQPNLPDPSALKGPLKKLTEIADACTSILEPYSRYLGKKETTKNDISALLLLPPELINDDTSGVITNFQSWADDKIESSDGLVTLGEFWQHIGTPLPNKVNKKESDLIQNLAQKSGYGIAPDSRFHGAKPTLDGNIVLFSGGHGEYFEPSNDFNEIAIILRLGAMVSAIDEHIADEEVSLLEQQISFNDRLSPTEKKSLHAYLIWRLNSPQKMTGLKAKLAVLSEEVKDSIGYILISVALADGKVEPDEIKQLEKLYTQLGLDKSKIASDIHNRTVSKVQPKRVDDKDKNLLLDHATLKFHESQTKDVQAMLGAIFVEDDITELEKVVETSGLDVEHSALYDMLISKEKWKRNDVLAQCQKLNLMIDGALETINDWSFDIVDAPIIDDDGDVYIDLEVVAELKG